MDVEIINNEFNLTLYGFSGIAVNRNYGDTGFKLMNNMWDKVRSNNLKNRGINVWVYDSDEKMFAGVELEETPTNDTGLELKKINLAKYACYKHIGPYSGLANAYSNMRAHLKEKNLKVCCPGLEIYGHWDPDENKLETDILMCLE